MYHPSLGDNSIFEKSEGVFEGQESAFTAKKQKSPFVSFRRVRPKSSVPYLTLPGDRRAQFPDGVVKMRDNYVEVPKKPATLFRTPGLEMQGKNLDFNPRATRRRIAHHASFVQPGSMPYKSHARFLAVDQKPLRRRVREDIREEVESFPSAAGLGQSDFVKSLASKVGLTDEQITKGTELYQQGQQIYKMLRPGDPAPAPVPVPTRLGPAQQTAAPSSGIKTSTILLIAGGGLAVVATAILLLKK